MFLLISTHFTATLGIPPTSTSLKTCSFKRRYRLSRYISRLTCLPAYAPFTPSNSGQRLPPTYYRGCWHVVSRGLLLSYRHYSSLRTEVYNPKTVFLHAALLHQGFPHCAIFPTAASRRSLGRVSVPMWPFNLSVRLLIVDLVGRYPTNYLIRREPILRHLSFDISTMRSIYVIRYYCPFPDTIPFRRAGCSRVTHPSATQSYHSSFRKNQKSSFVRLACVRHAASVRPEPGSNS